MQEGGFGFFSGIFFFSLAVLPGDFWRSSSSGLLNSKDAEARERIVLTATWEVARLREPAGRPSLFCGRLRSRWVAVWPRPVLSVCLPATLSLAAGVLHAAAAASQPTVHGDCMFSQSCEKKPKKLNMKHILLSFYKMS